MKDIIEDSKNEEDFEFHPWPADEEDEKLKRTANDRVKEIKEKDNLR